MGGVRRAGARLCAPTIGGVHRGGVRRGGRTAVRPYVGESSMPHDRESPQRRTIRLSGYDYRRNGAYFITLCTHGRAALFGAINDGTMRLNLNGQIVLDAWRETALIRPGVRLDEFIVMPNHFHAIVFLPDDTPPDLAEAHSDVPAPVVIVPRTPLHRPPRSLGALIAGFKSTVTKQINTRCGTPGVPVWQRNYYEHIIRNDDALQRIRIYIAHNPLTWESDDENPNRARQS